MHTVLTLWRVTLRLEAAASAVMIPADELPILGALMGALKFGRHHPSTFRGGGRLSRRRSSTCRSRRLQAPPSFGGSGQTFPVFGRSRHIRRHLGVRLPTPRGHEVHGDPRIGSQSLKSEPKREVTRGRDFNALYLGCKNQPRLPVSLDYAIHVRLVKPGRALACECVKQAMYPTFVLLPCHEAGLVQSKASSLEAPLQADGRVKRCRILRMFIADLKRIVLQLEDPCLITCGKLDFTFTAGATAWTNPSHPDLVHMATQVH